MTQDIDVGKLSEQLNDKADRDLWNTVPNVWNKTLNTSQITNCITEIPQDIKLELNNGVLTLKAGSKLYTPNGFEEDGITKKFDVKIIPSDLTYSYKGATSRYFQFVNPSLSSLLAREPERCYSGDTAPTITSTGVDIFWYDTSSNLVKRTTDNGSTWEEGYSLPTGLFSMTINVGTTHIDQVFNGLGYIGSTMFMLPGIKGLTPDGLNEDGTLKNKEVVTNIVSTWTVFFDATSGQSVFIGEGEHVTSGNILTSNSIRDYIISETMPDSPVNYTMWYNPKTNIIQRYVDEWFFAPCFYIGNWFGSKLAPYQITKVPDLIPLSLVNNYSKDYIAQQSFPSDRHIDLTIGASGSAYTAPANGYFIMYGSTNSNSYGRLYLGNRTLGSISSTTISGASLHVWLPVKKGDPVTATYENASVNLFQFIYAEGEK